MSVETGRSVFQALRRVENLEAPEVGAVPLAKSEEELLKTLTTAWSRLAGLENPSQLWLLVFLDYTVIWGSFSPDEGLVLSEPLDTNCLMELRMFGEAGEYYLWRETSGNFNARLRVDPLTPLVYPDKPENKGYNLDPRLSDPNVIDEWQVLWGTRLADRPASLPASSWSALTEERGMRLILPLGLIEEQLPLRLLVRHYLECDDDPQSGTGLFRYTDLRLVALADARFVKLIPDRK